MPPGQNENRGPALECESPQGPGSRINKKAAIRTVDHGQRPPVIGSDSEHKGDVMPGPHTWLNRLVIDGKYRSV